MSAFGVHVSLVVLAAVLLRGLVSLHPYSGEGKAPMFGDYEAQRHWMEITYHLPVEQWYVNSTNNDLMYWGLDYPPLTAYHSWLCGVIQERLNSSWVELFKSRGHESYDHKIFMRHSVLAVDLFIYIPAVLVYFFHCCKESVLSTDTKLVFALLSLLYPGLVLIDHGHFQYNCISLGLALWGVIGLCSGHDLLGAAAFTLALNYKQMELYHALPFFCYLLGACVVAGSARSGYVARLWKLLKVATVVIVVFVICWLPFLKKADTALLLQVVQRLFPFGRGLYEDKVANVWCSLSVVIKLKQMFEVSSLIRICLISTFLALLPSSIDLLFRPTVVKFKYALVNSSLVFFLFSFQVHEKSILLAAFMTPLFIKDGLIVAVVSLLVLFYVMADILLDQLRLADRVLLRTADRPVMQTSRRARPVHAAVVPELIVESISIHADKNLSILFGVSVAGMVIMFVASLVLHPPARLPDLFSVLISVYSCAHFLLFLLYFHWVQFNSRPAQLTEQSNGVERKKQLDALGKSRKQKTKLKSN